VSGLLLNGSLPLEVGGQCRGAVLAARLLKHHSGLPGPPEDQGSAPWSFFVRGGWQVAGSGSMDDDFDSRVDAIVDAYAIRYAAAATQVDRDAVANELFDRARADDLVALAAVAQIAYGVSPEAGAV
jgi:hypothetical protein